MSKQVGIRPMLIDMFLCSALSVSVLVRIKLIFIDMFLGSAGSVS